MSKKPEEKTAGQKLRELYWEMKKKRKPSSELAEMVKEYNEKISNDEEKTANKVARSYRPEAAV